MHDCLSTETRPATGLISSRNLTGAHLQASQETGVSPYSGHHGGQRTRPAASEKRLRRHSVGVTRSTSSTTAAWTGDPPPSRTPRRSARAPKATSSGTTAIALSWADWWCILDENEIYIDDPREFFARVPGCQGEAWSSSFLVLLHGRGPADPRGQSRGGLATTECARSFGGSGSAVKRTTGN